MKITRRLVSFLPVSIIVVALSVATLAQSDVRRTTTAITYPLDQTIEVPFRGTTRLPRLKGDAKVRRQGRRGTRVQLSLDHLPRGYELGGAYTTFVLWAISPNGTFSCACRAAWLCWKTCARQRRATLRLKPFRSLTSATPATTSATQACP